MSVLKYFKKSVKRSNLANAISIFTYYGIPISFHFDREDEAVNQQAFEGGFLSAITEFSKMKMNEKMTTITFESKDSGIFIVTRSQNYIGSLLWNKQLGYTLTESRNKLKDILGHLEDTCPINEQSLHSFNPDISIQGLLNDCT